jgi:hypothetical protein
MMDRSWGMGVITLATKHMKCHAGPDPASSLINSGFRLSPE